MAIAWCCMPGLRRAAGIGELASRAAGIAIGDLRRAGDVRNIANQVNAIGRMGAVIRNAGVYAERSRGSTLKDHASTLAINTLAPYLLTALIELPERLVYLSSGLHRGGEGSQDDLDWTKCPWDPAQAYAESKPHVVALAFALARRWPGVLSNWSIPAGCVRKWVARELRLTSTPGSEPRLGSR